MRHAAIYGEDEIPGDASELNLGMGTLVGVFFGLALVCGIFFGFGYMLGHRPAGPYVASEPLSKDAAPAPVPTAPKPSALVAQQPAEAPRVVLPVSSPDSPPMPAAAPQIARQTASSQSAPAIPQPKAVPVVAPVVSPAPIATTVPAGGGFMVQIAAVKNRRDAEALAEALRTNGFTPTIRTESQDKFIHVQVGPFASRDDAKAMRQKLSGAGYNAFIK